MDILTLENKEEKMRRSVTLKSLGLGGKRYHCDISTYRELVC